MVKRKGMEGQPLYIKGMLTAEQNGCSTAASAHQCETGELDQEILGAGLVEVDTHLLHAALALDAHHRAQTETFVGDACANGRHASCCCGGCISAGGGLRGWSEAGGWFLPQAAAGCGLR